MSRLPTFLATVVCISLAACGGRGDSGGGSGGPPAEPTLGGTTTVVVGGGAQVSSVAMADLNNDGRLDLITGSPSGVAAMINTSSSTTTTMSFFSRSFFR